VNILLINKFHHIRGGDSSYMFSLAEVLKNNGHAVTYFSMHHPLNIPCEQRKYFVDHIDFVEVNKNKNILNGIRVLSRVIYSRQARENIAKLIEDEHPDIVHLNNIHAHITPSILFEFKKQGIPVVWTLHDFQLVCPNTNMMSQGVICEACNGGNYIECLKRKCKKNSRSASFVSFMEATVHKYMNIAGMVDRFISPSKFLLEKFIQFGWDKSKMIHLPYFLTSDKFISEKTSGDSYALYMGRLESYKGVKTLLNAARHASEVRVKIVGEGSQKDSFVSMAKELKIENVEFTGYLSGNALNDVLHNSRYVVVPSEWYENYPYAVMEAMAAGKPVIASRIGGLPEMIEDGVTGFLFEPGNSADLAERMQKLMNDGEMRKWMGLAAKRKALERYNQDHHYRHIMDVYLEVKRKNTIKK
jgi:glycosyltransferase involved in cell wall biosynthesis